MGKSAGKIMPLPRGAYDENATYNILDMVTLDNKLWIATRSGVTGITPSKTTTEWMMAVDGTTDVKALETEVDAKFASIDEQFLAKDTQISGLDTRVTAAEGSITELDEKFVFDEKPTEGSTNLITSGAAYSMVNSVRDTMESDGTGELIKSKLSLYSTGIELQSVATQIFSGMDRDMSAIIRTDYGSPSMMCRHTYRSGGTTKYSSIGVSETTVSMSLAAFGDSSDHTYLRFDPEKFTCQDSGTYDIGSSYNKFKDIYATNGTIQTSDSTEKKDIADLDKKLVGDLIMGLRPVSFKFINGTSDRTHYGLVAQEVEETVNRLGISNQDFAPLIKTQKVETDENGNETPIDGEYVYGLRYSEFTAILIKMCQNLQNEVDELKVRLGGE